MTAHWGVDDPAAITSSPDAIEKAFSKTYDEMYRRIMAFLTLDDAQDEKTYLLNLRAIGNIDAVK